jgi:hypothetical protein
MKRPGAKIEGPTSLYYPNRKRVSSGALMLLEDISSMERKNAKNGVD